LRRLADFLRDFRFFAEVVWGVFVDFVPALLRVECTGFFAGFFVGAVAVPLVCADKAALAASINPVTKILLAHQLNRRNTHLTIEVPTHEYKIPLHGKLKEWISSKTKELALTP
jgi:hypothetical protein